MHATQCPDCFENFSRRDVMLRHRRNKHIGDKISGVCPQSSEAFPPSKGVLLQPPQQQHGVIQPPLPSPPPPPPLPPPPLQADEPPPQGGILPPQQEKNIATVLQHPFTMIISGPTGRF